jgi:Flp pilus assembly protein TadD
VSWPRLALVAVVVASLIAWAGRRADSRRKALFWCGWIVLTLLPTANLLEQEAPFAERYALLALVGAAGIVGEVLSRVWETPHRRRVALAASLAVLLAYSLISFHRGGYYRDDVAFHRQWIRTNPNSAQAHRSLGWALLERGELPEAFALIQRALQLNPENAQAWNNLGNVLMRSGRPEEAEELYRRALMLDSEFAQAHNNLGLVLAGEGKLEEAADHFRNAVRILPRYGEAHNNLGVVYARRRQWPEAATSFWRAVEIDDANAEAHANLGNVLVELGRPGEGRAHYARALELDPNHAAARRGLRALRGRPR